MSRCEYPRLPRSDIVTVLAESQIAKLTENDLKNPNPEFVSELYTRLLIYLDALSEEDQGQIEFSALEQLENPDLSIGSFPAFNLYSRIKDVVAALDCPMKFTLKDLIKPDAGRTEFFISTILNFVLYKSLLWDVTLDKTVEGNSSDTDNIEDAVINWEASLLFAFSHRLPHLIQSQLSSGHKNPNSAGKDNGRDTKMNLLRPIADDLSHLDEQRLDWDNKISQLNAEIASYNEVRQSELPIVQEVDAKVKELRQTVQSLNNQQMSLRGSFRKLKEKAGEMDKKISEAEYELVQSVQENANLRSRIVQSPDKLQSSLEEKKSAREEAKTAEISAMESFLEKSAALEVHMKVLKKMSKLSAQMQAIQEQVNSAKAVEKEYKSLNEKLSDNEVLFKSLELQLVERQGRVEDLDELSKQLRKERDLKLEESTKKCNDMKLQIDSLTANTKTVNESGAATVQVLVRKCEEVVQQYREYVNAVGELLPTFEFETD